MGGSCSAGGQVAAVFHAAGSGGLFNRKREFRRFPEHGSETLLEPAENVMQCPAVFMVGAEQHFPQVKTPGPRPGHEGWSDEGLDVP